MNQPLGSPLPGPHQPPRCHWGTAPFGSSGETRACPTIRLSVVAIRKLAGICLFAGVPGFAPAAPAPAPVLMADATRVKLLDGPFKQRQELHRTGYLASFEVDRLLFPYRAAAGLPQPPGATSGYGGWDAGFIRGHMAGHYLSAASRMFAATGDALFRDRANQLVRGLGECQRKFGTGHLAAFPESVIGGFETSQKGSLGIVVPYYTIHKVMAGLIDAHHYLGNAEALRMAERMADCYAARMRQLTDSQIASLLRTDRQRNPLTEFGGMSDALTELATATGHDRHLRLARVFIRDWFIDPLARGEDHLTGLHANTHVAQAMGVARYANAIGDPQATAAAEGFWRLVTEGRSFVIGGNSFKEWFDKPNVEAGPSIHDGKVLPYNTAETCNTHNMLKLTSRLFERRPDARYAAFSERALFNGILSSIAPDTGRVIYFHPLHGDFKTYLKGCECCEGTGIENTARYGEGIYYASADTLYVNLYVPSVLDWKETGLVIRQEGAVPWQDTVRFTIDHAENPVAVTLKLRQPEWAASGLRFEGVDQTDSPRADAGYLTVRRVWKTGDHFSIRLSPRITLTRSKDDPEMVSLAYGPLVLAARLGSEGMPADTNDKDVAANHPRPEVPAILDTGAAPSTWLHRSESSPLTFRATGCGPASGLVFQPVCDVHHERFAVYLPYLPPARIARRGAAEPLAPPRANRDLVDEVLPGRPDSEESHDLASDKSQAGTGPHGRLWRDAAPDGWFSYTLANRPGADLELTCVWWGSDRDREFEILANGRKIATEHLTASNPGRYFETTTAIPREALAGQQHVAVRFQGIGKGRAGGVFGVRLRQRGFTAN